MDAEAMKSIMKENQKWMEDMLKRTTQAMERLLQNHPSTSSSIPKFRPFVLEQETWDTYLFQLKQHFSANNLTDENLKKAHFLSTCGSYINEVLEKLFETNDVSTNTFKDITTKLTSHFKTNIHILASRCKFLRQKMIPGQSYANWIADLKGLARDCNFVCSKEGCNTSYADSMIRDMLVFYTPHDPVRIAATQKKNPSLAEIEELVTAYESTQIASDILKGSSTSASIEVNQINAKGHQSNYSSKSNEQAIIRKSCPACFKHHERSQCKHIDSVCNNCNRRGHISSVCLALHGAREKSRSKSTNRSKSRGRRPFKKFNRNDTAHSINLVEDSEQQVLPTADSVVAKPVEQVSLACQSQKRRKIFVSLLVNQVPAVFQLDTGATCSLVGLDEYHRLGCPRCEPTDRTLKAYGDVEVPVKGVTKVSVSWQNKTCDLSLMVVNNSRGANIMGIDWFDAFNCEIIFGKDEVVSQMFSEPREELVSEAKAMCQKYKSVFSPGLGCSKFFEAHLTLINNSHPKFCKHRPVPFAQKDKVRKELERLIALGVLKRVDASQWAAPIVPVEKSNGKIRICGDFRITINPQLIIVHHPLPRAQELFHKVQGGQYFTKLDFSDAYLQIPLDDHSKQLCVINTEIGLLQYQRLPFGTGSSTGIFQQYLDQLTADIDFCGAYVDDIIVSGRTNAEHLHNLQVLLERLERHGLRCNLEKSQFAKKQIEYLGHIIDSNGIRPAESRLKAISDLPKPSNLKELEAFIGKLNYYNQFIDNFAQLAAPLNKLRSPNEAFVWNKEQQIAFDKCKDKILNVSQLVHFSNDLPITLATDASSYGIGAVISHIFPDKTERPIAFASKTLDESQRKYSQIEKEALSIVFGVKKFNEYLYGRQFELITDHQPLVAIFSPSRKLPHMTIQRLQRWAIVLMGYTYTIRYRSTKQHGNADCLSRLPIGPDKNFDQSEEACQLDGSSSTLVEDFPVDAAIIAEACQKDEIIQKVFAYVQNGWPTSLPSTDEHLLPYFRRRFSLTIHSDVLLFHSESPRVVIPHQLQRKVLTLLHQGHWGISRMKQMSRRYCWWPNIDRDIQERVGQCHACQLNASQSPKEYTSWPTTAEVWERIHIDFAGPFQKHMWLIVMDSNSKFPFVIKMSTTTSHATICALRSIFALEGLPKTLVSDNGTQFMSKEFKEYCRKNSIQHLTSAPFNPESNGAAERMVRTFKSALLKILGDRDISGCEEALSIFLSTFRATPDENGTSPAEKLHGRQHRTQLSVIVPEFSKKRYTQQVTTKFSVNQQVFARQYLPKKKWVHAVVKKQLGKRMYLVETETGTWRRHQNQMRPGFENKITPGPQISPVELQSTSSQSRRSVSVGIGEDIPNQRQQPGMLDESDIEVTTEASPPIIDLDTSPTLPKSSTSKEMTEQELRGEEAVLRRSNRPRKEPVRFVPN